MKERKRVCHILCSGSSDTHSFVVFFSNVIRFLKRNIFNYSPPVLSNYLASWKKNGPIVLIFLLWSKGYIYGGQGRAILYTIFNKSLFFTGLVSNGISIIIFLHHVRLFFLLTPPVSISLLHYVCVWFFSFSLYYIQQLFLIFIWSPNNRSSFIYFKHLAINPCQTHAGHFLDFLYSSTTSLIFAPLALYKR